jgi:hypothetical protein
MIKTDLKKCGRRKNLRKDAMERRRRTRLLPDPRREAIAT